MLMHGRVQPVHKYKRDKPRRKKTTRTLATVFKNKCHVSGLGQVCTCFVESSDYYSGCVECMHHTSAGYSKHDTERCVNSLP